MAPDSCTVAVDIAEHHVTIHFKSDNEVRRIYVHPDNVVMTSSKQDWSNRTGTEQTLHQNKYQARVSIKNLCQALKNDRSNWGNLGVDDVMAQIHEKIGMSPTLWTTVQVWIRRIVSGLVSLASVAMKAITFHHTAGLLGWQ